MSRLARPRLGHDGTVAAFEPLAPALRGRPRSPQADRAIIQAALQSLIDDGYAGFTMAGVAHGAGVSTATLYRRFHDKDDLVIAALEQFGEGRSMADTGTLPGDLCALLTRLVEALNGDGGRLMEGMLSEMVRNKALAEKLRTRLMDTPKLQLGEMLERAAARGEIPPVTDVGLIENLLVGPLYHRLVFAGQPLDMRVVDAVLPMLLRALGYPAEALPPA
jgi:AcrR family transcriptional regulator